MPEKSIGSVHTPSKLDSLGSYIGTSARGQRRPFYPGHVHSNYPTSTIVGKEETDRDSAALWLERIELACAEHCLFTTRRRVVSRVVSASSGLERWTERPAALSCVFLSKIIDRLISLGVKELHFDETRIDREVNSIGGA